MELRALLADASFPLFGISRRRWEGPSFVGDAVRTFAPESRLHTVQIVYLDGLDGTTMGAVVSSIDPRAPVENPIEAHLGRFIPRFNADFVIRKFRRRSTDPYNPGRFRTQRIAVTVAGQTIGGDLFHHGNLPVQLLRVAIRRAGAIVDLGIGTWNLEAVAIAERVEYVDERFATDFDGELYEPYPPEEWTGG